MHRQETFCVEFFVGHTQRFLANFFGFLFTSAHVQSDRLPNRCGVAELEVIFWTAFVRSSSPTHIRDCFIKTPGAWSHFTDYCYVKAICLWRSQQNNSTRLCVSSTDVDTSSSLFRAQKPINLFDWSYHRLRLALFCEPLFVELAKNAKPDLGSYRCYDPKTKSRKSEATSTGYIFLFF